MAVPTNRKEFLALLRESCAYKGADDLAAVKKFIEDEGHTLVDEDDNPLDVDAIWSKTGGKKIQVNTQVTETVAEKETRLAGKTTRPGSGTNRAAGVDATIHAGGVDRVSAAKKSYDFMAKNNRTAFPDADMAEACGAWMRSANAIVNGKTYARLEEDLRICEKAGSGVNMTTGGAFVPEDFHNQILYLSENYGVVRRLFNVQKMMRDTAQWSRQTGEFVFAFAGENGSLTADELDTDLIQLTAKKAYGMSRLPSELLEDAAVNVGDVYARAYAKGLAKLEDQCGLLGDGTSTYGGIVGVLNAVPSTAFTAQGTGSTWAAQVQADIDNQVGRVENVEFENCAFVCSRQYFFQVMKPLSTASGRGSINEFLTVRGTGGPADAQWGGWPVYFSQVMPTATATSQKPFFFGDFRSAAMFGDRRELSIVSSEHRYFDQDQIAIRGTSRFAINVHGDGRGSTYGPITGVKTS